MVFIIVSTFFFFVSSFPVFACEPCPTFTTFPDVLRDSDLILIGHKISDSAKSDHSENVVGPNWVDVQVVDTLKGFINTSRVRINSWDGMCSYGIVLPDARDYLIFLQKNSFFEETKHYDAVNFGCSQSSYLVENNFVHINNQLVSLDSLIDKYHLRSRFGAHSSSQTSLAGSDGVLQVTKLLPWYVALAVIISAALYCCLRRYCRKA